MTLFNEIMKLRPRVVFRHLGIYAGWTEPAEGDGWAMSIDLKGVDNPAMTYIHECIHLLYPVFSEKKVLELEQEVWVSLTPHQRFQIYKRLFNRKYRYHLTGE